MHFEVLMRNVLEKEQNWQVVSNIHDIKFTKDGSLPSSHSKSELLLLSRATRSVAPLPASEMAIPLQPCFMGTLGLSIGFSIVEATRYIQSNPTSRVYQLA